MYCMYQAMSTIPDLNVRTAHMYCYYIHRCNIIMLIIVTIFIVVLLQDCSIFNSVERTSYYYNIDLVYQMHLMCALLSGVAWNRI